jgi:hypothetical protein
MNVEIGAETALFPEKEYINGIAVAVHLAQVSSRKGAREHVLPMFYHGLSKNSQLQATVNCSSICNSYDVTEISNGYPCQNSVYCRTLLHEEKLSDNDTVFVLNIFYKNKFKTSITLLKSARYTVP